MENRPKGSGSRHVQLPFHMSPSLAPNTTAGAIMPFMHTSSSPPFHPHSSSSSSTVDQQQEHQQAATMVGGIPLRAGRHVKGKFDGLTAEQSSAVPSNSRTTSGGVFVQQQQKQNSSRNSGTGAVSAPQSTHLKAVDNCNAAMYLPHHTRSLLISAGAAAPSSASSSGLSFTSSHLPPAMATQQQHQQVYGQAQQQQDIHRQPSATDMQLLRRASSSEIANSPFTPPRQALQHQISSALKQRIQKTKLCVHHLHGRCARGPSCAFAHSVTELRRPPNLYKTRLCTNFANNLVCPKGDLCRFAHGEQELRANDGQAPLGGDMASSPCESPTLLAKGIGSPATPIGSCRLSSPLTFTSDGSSGGRLVLDEGGDGRNGRSGGDGRSQPSAFERTPETEAVDILLRLPEDTRQQLVDFVIRTAAICPPFDRRSQGRPSSYNFANSSNGSPDLKWPPLGAHPLSYPNTPASTVLKCDESHNPLLFGHSMSLPSAAIPLPPAGYPTPLLSFGRSLEGGNSGTQTLGSLATADASDQSGGPTGVSVSTSDTGGGKHEGYEIDNGGKPAFDSSRSLHQQYQPIIQTSDHQHRRQGSRQNSAMSAAASTHSSLNGSSTYGGAGDIGTGRGGGGGGGSYCQPMSRYLKSPRTGMYLDTPSGSHMSSSTEMSSSTNAATATATTVGDVTGILQRIANCGGGGDPSNGGDASDDRSNRLGVGDLPSNNNVAPAVNNTLTAGTFDSDMTSFDSSCLGLLAEHFATSDLLTLMTESVAAASDTSAGAANVAAAVHNLQPTPTVEDLRCARRGRSLSSAAPNVMDDDTAATDTTLQQRFRFTPSAASPKRASGISASAKSSPISTLPATTMKDTGSGVRQHSGSVDTLLNRLDLSNLPLWNIGAAALGERDSILPPEQHRNLLASTDAGGSSECDHRTTKSDRRIPQQRNDVPIEQLQTSVIGAATDHDLADQDGQEATAQQQMNVNIEMLTQLLQEHHPTMSNFDTSGIDTGVLVDTNSGHTAFSPTCLNIPDSCHVVSPGSTSPSKETIAAEKVLSDVRSAGGATTATGGLSKELNSAWVPIYAEGSPPTRVHGARSQFI